LIGYTLWAGVADMVFAWHLPSINPHNFEKVAAMFSKYGVWFILAAAFTPLPYKVITITAGSMAVSPQIAALPFFTMFVAVSVVGRGARFFLVSALCKRWGPPILPFIDKHFGWLSLAFTLLLAGGFYAIKFLH
jgi:membrane protein YqaA with SNARE-associated domain